MNAPLILELIGLRYKLLWAKTRSRNGRIALFLSGYLLLLLLLVLLAFGGFGAAFAAVRSGKALFVASAVLSGLFVQAIISTNILGFGMSTVFGETELRRYPLSAADRRLARHLTTIVDPFWCLFLALELGLAFGLFGLEAAELAPALGSVALFFVCNYLWARVVGAWVDRLMKRKGGATILLALVMFLGLAPGPIATMLKNRPALASRIGEQLVYTPPFAASAAMVSASGQAARGWLLLLLWTAGAAAILIRLEKRPPERQAAVTTTLSWSDTYDRLGAFFGPGIGPFVAHWLRFYTRNPRTRTLAVLSVPLAAFLTYSTSRTQGPDGVFIAALGTISIATYLGTSRLVVNQFGYCGGAFRRYFLLPAPPETTLRAASYAAVSLGGAAIPVTLLLWIVLVPPFDPRRLLMLAASAITGLMLFNAAGLWVTLFNPRKGNYNSNFGNDLSLGGNVVLIGSVILAMLLPRLLHHFYPFLVTPDAWYMVLPLPVLAVLVYRFSLRAAGPVFRNRRERLLAVVEGRD